MSELLHLQTVRAPHGSTYGRLLANGIDLDEFSRLARAFFEALPQAGESLVINLDGKHLRATIPAGRTHGVHLLAAFLPREGWVLLQLEVGHKENEISVAPRVLQALDLRGKIVTGDAMLAQRDLSLQIVQAGGDYLWTVKNNQSDLYDAIATLFAPERVTKGFSAPKKEMRLAKTVGIGHGRLELRQLTASGELKAYLGWPGAEQVFRIVRTFTRQADGKPMHEISFGITRLTSHQADAPALLRLVREHWQIENALHYRRDVTFREDWCTLRRGKVPQLMAALNNLVLGILQRTGATNIPHARRHYDAHFDQAAKLLLCALP
ncbi:MAG: ISAs1 family transposase [Anaerolineae bacterium]|nr:ISAs1 family transposase [Anaerolineae bacterium]